MNPFKSQGFDSLIAKGLKIEGHLTLAPGSTTQLDGVMAGETIAVDVDASGKIGNTTLIVNGQAKTIRMIVVPNVTITGEVECSALEVSGILAIKKGARVTCNRILYNVLIVETGAIVNGQLVYNDNQNVKSEPTSTEVLPISQR